MTRSAAANACALVLGALALAAAPAWAQSVGDPEPPEDPVAAEAQMRYRHGRELYQEGRYGEAVVELERALALDPDEPVLLYNLSLVHEKLDNFEEAIGYMRRVLDSGVEGEERARVEAAIRRLEGARQHAVPAPPAVVRVPVLPPAERPRPAPSFGRADAAFFVVAGVAVVALATTAVTGAMALSEQTEVDRFYLGEDGTMSDRRAHVLNANDLALVADVALVTGGVAAVTATLLYALRRAEPEEETPTPSIGWAPGGAVATLRGRF